MKKSQNHFLTFILLFFVGLGGGKVGECVAARITEQLFTLTGWTHVPSVLRLHRTPRSPSVELFYRGQTVILAWHRGAFHPAVHIWDREEEKT